VCYRATIVDDDDASATDPACTTPPAAPTDLVASWFEGNILLTWTDNSRVEDGFVVVIRTNCLLQEDYWWYDTPADVTSYLVMDWAEWWQSGGCRAVGYYVLAHRDGGQSDPSNVAAPEF
jgi:hypothetical protein